MIYTDLPGSAGPEPSRAPIFGVHAVALKRAGLAVIPGEGKKPLCDGFPKWTHGLGYKAIEQWAARKPGADILYIPGLSRTRHNPYGVIVVDADNDNERERAREFFGYTPGEIDTRRGGHGLWRAPDESIPVDTLRDLGWEVDLRHGQAFAGIAVAPPSRHEKDRSVIYSWAKDSGPDAIRELPPFPLKRMMMLLDTYARGQGVGIDLIPHM